MKKTEQIAQASYFVTFYRILRVHRIQSYRLQVQNGLIVGGNV